MSKYIKIIMVVMPLLCQGCATPVQKVHNIPGEARLFTPDIRKEIYPELSYYGADQFKLGLALSGGGVRSASFSIGALSGLHQAKLLDKVDVISSVSGGGYAAYWFMNALLNLEQPLPDIRQEREASFSRAELFADGATGPRDNKYRFQYSLAQRSDLLYYSLNDLVEYFELGGKLTAQLPSIPVHHIANSVFDWGLNASTWRKYYQNGIERTYGLVPKDISPESYKDRKYYNAESVMSLDNAKTQELTFAGLREYTRARWQECSLTSRDAGNCVRPPLWVINMTAGVANHLYEWMERRQSLSRTVFSVTPFSYGSDEYGYVHNALDQLTVPQAVAISGAAIDAQDKGNNGKGNFFVASGEHLLNINLGYSIDNYNPERSSIAFHKFLPWPLYYLHGFTRNKDSVDIYLSDGGHSENLGAYSLIMRGVGDIIVIDAEHDNTGQFEALTKLKKALRNEGLYLSFFAADDQQTDVDFEKEFKKGKEDRPYDPHDAPRSIFHLKVKGFQPGYISTVAAENYVNIIYVKLSINADEQHMNISACDPACTASAVAYPCSVVSYYQENNLNADRTVKTMDNHFPQHVTFAGEVKSSPRYYYAYRDLGAYLTSRITLVNGRLSYSDGSDPCIHRDCPPCDCCCQKKDNTTSKGEQR